MNKYVYIALALFLLLFAVFASAGGDRSGVYLIKSHDASLKAKYGVRHNFDSGFTTSLPSSAVEALKKKGVELEEVPLWRIAAPKWCTPDSSHPACSGDDSGDSGGRAVPSDQTPWGIEMIYQNPALVSASGGAGVKVAVLDTGVNRYHPDLKNRVADCKDFTKGTRPKNSCDDSHGHGTHVSGTILADSGSDGLGIYGVAPEAKLLAYKVCGNDGYCWSDDIAAAIDYAGSHGANIISMSLGGSSESSLTRDAIARNSHVLVVAAAGNSGPAEGSINYPGANPGVVAVGAIDSSELVPSWSSRGVNDGDYLVEAREVEVGAPGVNVLSTLGDAYGIMSGTSMATPHVSGLTARHWQGSAGATRAWLQGRAKLHDLHTSGDDSSTGFGLPTVG